MGRGQRNKTSAKAAAETRRGRSQSAQRERYLPEDEIWMRGSCVVYMQTLCELKPGLRMGIHWQDINPTDDGYDDEDLQDYLEDHDEVDENDETTWPVQTVPQHFFAHDDVYAYDATGRHLLPYDDWSRTTLDGDPVDADLYGMTEGDEDDAREHAMRKKIFLTDGYKLI